MKLQKKFLLLALAAAFTVGGAFTSMAKTRLETPEGLYWSNTSKEDADDEKEGTYARWDEVEEAHQYEVYLYRENSDGDTTKVAEIKTKKLAYNFRSKMDKEGDYCFKVRALAKGSSYYDSYWSDYSDTHYISESGAENANISEVVSSVVTRRGWVQDERGWWYERNDGTWPANGWFQDPASGYWYYMDESGYMKTGWISIDYGNGPVNYYCDPAGTPQGAMLANQEAVIDGVTYVFDENGAVVLAN